MVESMNRWWRNLGIKGFLKGAANHSGNIMGPVWRQSRGGGQCPGDGSAAWRAVKRLLRSGASQGDMGMLSRLSDWRMPEVSIGSKQNTWTSLLRLWQIWIPGASVWRLRSGWCDSHHKRPARRNDHIEPVSQGERKWESRLAINGLLTQSKNKR